MCTSHYTRFVCCNGLALLRLKLGRLPLPGLGRLWLYTGRVRGNLLIVKLPGNTFVGTENKYGN